MNAVAPVSCGTGARKGEERKPEVMTKNERKTEGERERKAEEEGAKKKKKTAYISTHAHEIGKKKKQHTLLIDGI